MFLSLLLVAGLGRPVETHQISVPMGYIGPAYVPVSVPRYNGGLAAVKIGLCQATAYEFSAENRHPFLPGWFYFGQSPLVDFDFNYAGVVLRDPVSEINIVDSPTGLGLYDWSVQLGPYDGVVDYSGTSGASSGYLSHARVDSVWLFPGDPLFDLFVGEGNVQLETRRLGWWHFSSDIGAVRVRIDGWAGARFHVHYYAADAS